MKYNFSIKERSDGLFFFHLKEAFRLESKKSIPELVLAYECYGEMNVDKSNVVLIHHALSGSSHVSSHSKNKEKGWWNEMVGSGKAIDTDKYFVVCINNFGSCYGSSGPTTVNPETNKTYQASFPVYTFNDISNSQKILFDCLGVDKLFAVIGSSVGAMVSLDMLVNYPDYIQKVILISSTSKAYASNIANRLIQSRIIKSDPEWNNGFYFSNPVNGLRNARKLALYTYRSSNELDDRFKRLEDITLEEVTLTSDVSEVESYLMYNAEKFVKKFDTNTYLFLLKAMDLYDISDGKGVLKDNQKEIESFVSIISVNTDILFPPKQQRDIYELLKVKTKDIEYVEHVSDFGHDSFLIEIDVIGEYIKNVLNGVGNGTTN